MQKYLQTSAIISHHSWTRLSNHTLFFYLSIKSYLIDLSKLFSKPLTSSIEAVLCIVFHLSIDDCSLLCCRQRSHEIWQFLQVMDFVSRYLPAYHAYLPTLYKEGPNGAKKDHLLVIDIDEERTPISGS
uniref:Uncharacterized protein n=1 Tax=Aegilops tauschii subsp. strangulata TaxID=200361 RepID=A0A453FCT2_AEGTS